MNSFRKRAFVFLCQNEFMIMVVFALSSLGFLFTVFSLFALDRESGAFVVAVINLPGLLFMMGFTGFVLRRCRDRMSVE